MDDLEPEIEAPLREALRRGREVSPRGFTERALVAVRRDVARRRVIRWTSAGASLAACAAALALYLAPAVAPSPSEGDLAQLLSLHDQVVLAHPRLDDTEALAVMVLADLEESAAMPRLEGAEETIARIVLGS